MSTLKQEIITPDRAKELLNHNVDNRKVVWSNVHKYAKDMKNGKWGDSNDEILINSEGCLVNGQHRLLAIIESGETIPMDIKYGFDNGNGAVDILHKRTTADQMKMHGVDSQLCTKETVGLINCYLRILLGDIREWTDFEKETFICKNADNLLLAISISKKGANHAILKKASTQSAIFAALNAGVSEDKLYRFAVCVNTSYVTGDYESSALVLRKYLQQPNPLGGPLIQNNQCASTEQAIKDFVNGISRRKAYPVNKHVYLIPQNKGGDDLSAV